MSDIVSELLDRAYSYMRKDILCERAAIEIERLRLTDAERSAIEFFQAIHNEGYGLFAKHTATLRKLLERLQ
jgi:hypothetical protein